jgi:hypothetical protein
MSADRQRRKSRQARKRTYNTRLIKRDYTYFVGEIAELFDVHPQAVRRWIRGDLPTIDERRPFLIHGGDLIAFLDARQAKRKQQCAANELYCLRCRRPRRPRFGRVTLAINSATRIDLSGTCETCGTRMHRAGSVARLEEYSKVFRVEMPGEGRITGCSDPSLMCHLSKE